MNVPLERLYLEHEPRVRWLLRARGVPEGALDDLVHDSFVAIYRRWPSREPELPLEQWITGIARNVAFSYRRSEARRYRRRQEVPAPSVVPQPDEILADREALAAIRAFTKSLSPKLRETFLLTDIAGVGVAQAARALGLPTPTVQSRRRLARVQFQKHFGDRSQADRRALRTAAARKGTPHEARRRDHLAAIGVSVGQGSSLVLGGTASATAWIVGTVALSAIGMVALRLSLPPTEPPHLARTVVTPSIESLAVRPPVTAPVAVPAALPAETIPVFTQPPALQHPRPQRAKSKDPLLRDLALLEKAKRKLSAGDATAAVRLLKSRRLATTKLVLEHRRLLLEASCADDDPSSAQDAARALQKMGVAANPDAPCVAAEKNK